MIVSRWVLSWHSLTKQRFADSDFISRPGAQPSKYAALPYTSSQIQDQAHNEVQGYATFHQADNDDLAFLNNMPRKFRAWNRKFVKEGGNVKIGLLDVSLNEDQDDCWRYPYPQLQSATMDQSKGSDYIYHRALSLWRMTKRCSIGGRLAVIQFLLAEMGLIRSLRRPHELLAPLATNINYPILEKRGVLLVVLR